MHARTHACTHIHTCMHKHAHTHSTLSLSLSFTHYLYIYLSLFLSHSCNQSQVELWCYLTTTSPWKDLQLSMFFLSLRIWTTWWGCYYLRPWCCSANKWLDIPNGARDPHTGPLLMPQTTCWEAMLEVVWWSGVNLELSCCLGIEMLPNHCPLHRSRVVPV